MKISSGRDVLLAVRTSGDVIGETALLEMAPRSATARARGACKLLAIHKTLLDELVQGSASAARVMFFTVLARWRATGRDAAAVREDGPARHAHRGRRARAQQPGRRRPARRRSARRRARGSARRRARAGAAARDAVVRAHDRRPCEQPSATSAARLSDLDALTRGDREEQVEAWLDARAVADAGELAPDAGDARLRRREAGSRWPPTSAPPTCRPSRAGSRPRTWSGTASPRSRRAPGASPRSSRRSRATPTSIRRPCRRSTFTRASTARWSSCATS